MASVFDFVYEGIVYSGVVEMFILGNSHLRLRDTPNDTPIASCELDHEDSNMMSVTFPGSEVRVGLLAGERVQIATMNSMPVFFEMGSNGWRLEHPAADLNVCYSCIKGVSKWCLSWVIPDLAYTSKRNLARLKSRLETLIKTQFPESQPELSTSHVAMVHLHATINEILGKMDFLTSLYSWPSDIQTLSTKEEVEHLLGEVGRVLNQSTAEKRYLSIAGASGVISWDLPAIRLAEIPEHILKDISSICGDKEVFEMDQDTLCLAQEANSTLDETARTLRGIFHGLDLLYVAVFPDLLQALQSRYREAERFPESTELWLCQ